VTTVRVPYEPLRPGPRGQAVEVLDYDASAGRYYRAVDLEDPQVLLEGGLEPSTSDPRFHQQMVYAVVMRTLQQFSYALGREMGWSRRRGGRADGQARPLRVLPHARREANAYYDPATHALYFGYFPISGAADGGPLVFTCLSHDIVTHETTHALLHDVRQHYMELTNSDTLAFHEAFADIVALLQHFTFRDALLEHVIGTGGMLQRATLDPLFAGRPRNGAGSSAPSTLAEAEQRNVLVGLAQEMGQALGYRAELRAALGSPADPAEYERRTEPHERGAILVAAVFDAFFTVYATRVKDLLRIAGFGRNASDGELSRELVERLAGEASKTAQQFLNMCIRALDYCPPVDISFGDYLRALLTVDAEVVPHDTRSYRDIIVEAFRRRGLLPSGVQSHSPGALEWEPPETRSGRRLFCEGLRFDVIHGTSKDLAGENATLLHSFARRHWRELRLSPKHPIQPWRFHPASRCGPGGPDAPQSFQVIVELLQKQELPIWGESGPKGIFRGGCTLVLDAKSGEVRHAVFKRLASRHRRQRLQAFWQDWLGGHVAPFREPDARSLRANFARLHVGW